MLLVEPALELGLGGARGELALDDPDVPPVELDLRVERRRGRAGARRGGEVRLGGEIFARAVGAGEKSKLGERRAGRDSLAVQQYLKAVGSGRGRCEDQRRPSLCWGCLRPTDVCARPPTSGRVGSLPGAQHHKSNTLYCSY